MDEGARNDDLTAVASGQGSGYAGFGERVAGILEAAEEAAERIRESARHEAAELERLAAVEAERLQNELTAEARARCAAEVRAALGELRSALQRPLGRSAPYLTLRKNLTLRPGSRISSLWNWVELRTS